MAANIISKTRAEEKALNNLPLSINRIKKKEKHSECPGFRNLCCITGKHFAAAFKFSQTKDLPLVLGMLTLKTMLKERKNVPVDRLEDLYSIIRSLRANTKSQTRKAKGSSLLRIDPVT